MNKLPEARPAEIVAEYGPFDAVEGVHGVTFDGARVWFAHDGGLVAFPPESTMGLRPALPGSAPNPVRPREEQRLAVEADAGTAFDGKHLWQIAGHEIRKIDPETGDVLARIPAPSTQSSGLAYAGGVLWVGEYRGRKIHKVDARTGKVLRTVESDAFVTGVTFADDELWHGTLEGGASEIRRVDVETGMVLDRLRMPEGALVSGLEAAGDVFYAGAHRQDRAAVRAVRRPRRG
jgi:outer membrane protein assembly factor BamB